MALNTVVNQGGVTFAPPVVSAGQINVPILCFGVEFVQHDVAIIRWQPTLNLKLYLGLPALPL